MNNMNNMNDVNGRDNAATRPAILQLPQLCLQGALSCFQQACLLVVGGRAPDVEWLRKASEGRIVWAVDHGLDACLAAGIVPQRLIGDGDSAAPAAWHFAEEKGIPIEKFPPEKDDTDTQLALRIAKEDGFPAALLRRCRACSPMSARLSSLCTAGNPLHVPRNQHPRPSPCCR